MSKPTSTVTTGTSAVSEPATVSTTATTISPERARQITRENLAKFDMFGEIEFLTYDESAGKLSTAELYAMPLEELERIVRPQEFLDHIAARPLMIFEKPLRRSRYDYALAAASASSPIALRLLFETSQKYATPKSSEDYKRLAAELTWQLLYEGDYLNDPIPNETMQYLIDKSGLTPTALLTNPTEFLPAEYRRSEKAAKFEDFDREALGTWMFNQAAIYIDPKFHRTLLACGFDPLNAMLKAASKGRKDILTSLLEGGVDANIHDADLVSPLLYSRVKGHTDCTGVLTKYGAVVPPEIVARQPGSVSILVKIARHLLSQGVALDDVKPSSYGVDPDKNPEDYTAAEATEVRRLKTLEKYVNWCRRPSLIDNAEDTVEVVNFMGTRMAYEFETTTGSKSFTDQIRAATTHCAGNFAKQNAVATIMCKAIILRSIGFEEGSVKQLIDPILRGQGIVLPLESITIAPTEPNFCKNGSDARRFNLGRDMGESEDWLVKAIAVAAPPSPAVTSGSATSAATTVVAAAQTGR